MMKFYKHLLLFLLCFAYATQCFSQDKPVKRFLGFHFDFHATKNDKEIGKTFSTEVIEQFLSTIKPDYIQVDTKGHQGISSYPTDVGYDTDIFQKDVMQLWRQVTLKNGVDLYVHYSGLLDKEAITNNPHWAKKNNNKEANKERVSIFSNYSDSLLIPQIKELITRYNIDGVWFDGDAWALEPDYSENALTLYRQRFNSDAPTDSQDRNYTKFLDFNRDYFKKYLQNYADELHSHDPDFKITSNWAYSSMMPEPLDVKLDFLSGDLSSKNWISNAAFQSRCFASYKKPWDLMAWSFSDKGTKPINLLLLEASEVIAMGGGFESYWIQNRDASINPAYFPVMQQIADFCRARENYTYNSQIIPQVGVFFSLEAWKKKTGSLYGSSGSEAISGIVTMLLDGGNAVDIVMEHQLEEEINNHPVMVIPEWEYISSSNKNIFLNYAKMGGKLLLMGSETVQNFENELGVEFEGSNVFSEFNINLNGENKRFELPIQIADVNSAEVIINSSNSSFPLTTLTNYGRGKIAAIYYDAGEQYILNEDSYLRTVADSVINVLYTNPIVKINSDVKLHTVISAKENKQHIHLINVNGLSYKAPAEAYTNITPAQNVNIMLRLSYKPSRIIQQPENIPLEFNYTNGMAELNVPQINIYSILEIEP